MVITETTMSVPGKQEFMLPLLKIAGDGQDHTVAEAMETLARQLQISDADRDILLPSGRQTRFNNRVNWAITDLRISLLLDRVGRGRFKATPRGLEVLAKNPARIDNAFLEQFDEYRAFKIKKNTTVTAAAGDADEGTDAAGPDVTPDERLDAAYKELREALADDVLDRVRSSTPKFFEHLVVDLLVAMGYGGTQASSAQVVGRSGDGGIDGVIPEDRLGLDMVYVQAKKWENAVGPDEIRKFVGSLGEQKAHKGVFITSGTFTGGARQAAERAMNAKVVLIDGEQLAQLMIDHGVGVADHKPYVVKKLDSDYFEGV
jgi:restriction system protein